MAEEPQSSARSDPFSREGPFDAEQWAMHGLLHAYFDIDRGRRGARIENVLSRIAREQTGHSGIRLFKPRWQTAALWAAALAAVVGTGLAVRFLARPAASAPGGALAGATKDTNVVMVRLETAENRTLPIGQVGSLCVRGPADLDLVGTSFLRLRRGCVRVQLTSPKGRGFVVKTPRGDVTDLGTEFGVDVGGDSATGVVVFRGAVNLAVPRPDQKDSHHVEHLVQGEGVLVDEAGRLDRIMSIVTEPTNMFRQAAQTSAGGRAPVIADVRDNVRISECKQFYEIVPGGLCEDAAAYVDRPAHEWNGVTKSGMPAYLLGADYVRTFNNDKLLGNIEICVRLSRPARLFIFLDQRVSPPDWLRRDFQCTGDDVGLDVGPFVLDGVFHRFSRGVGPGNSIDVIDSIWQRIIDRPGVVRLGPNLGGSWNTGMYGIAAVALDSSGPREADSRSSNPLWARAEGRGPETDD